MMHEQPTFNPAKVRELLYAQNKSQDWLASETGYSREMISRYMNGHHLITLKFAMKAAVALGVPVHWLEVDRVAA